MRCRVTAKQPNSSMCLVCGLHNDAGIKASFYELENGELLARFRPREEHQGYPGRLHGGIATAILDETIGRAIMIKEEGAVWGVSVEITTRFKKPVPIAGEIRAVGRITKNRSRLFEGTGRILLEDGTVAVTATGRYLKLPIEEIADFDTDGQWKVVPAPDDPSSFNI